MHTAELTLHTGTRVVTDITGEAGDFCAGLGDGLLSVFVPHATAGVALMETGSGSEPDLEAALERLLPRQDMYRHGHGSLGHGRDHVVPAFIAASLVVPVLDGRPALGVWQSIVVVDTNGDNGTRHVRLSFLAG